MAEEESNLGMLHSYISTIPDIGVSLNADPRP